MAKNTGNTSVMVAGRYAFAMLRHSRATLYAVSVACHAIFRLF